MQIAQKRAQARLTNSARNPDDVDTSGKLHVLRHTFCSHLAMLGAAPKVIQDFAGHSDLATTQRYLHLTDESRRTTVALLDRREPQKGSSAFGDILETGSGVLPKP